MLPFKNLGAEPERILGTIRARGRRQQVAYADRNRIDASVSIEQWQQPYKRRGPMRVAGT